jgi:hypothetical protein
MMDWHERLTDWCIAHARLVLVASLAICAGFAWYTVERFAINTDTARLISPQTPWRQAEIAFDTAFPSRTDLVVVVLDARTPEQADAAAATLTETLLATKAFRTVRRPDGGDFFDKYGFLFQSDAEFRATMADIIGQQPFLSIIAADPGIGGVFDAIRLGLRGAAEGRSKIQDMRPAMTAISRTIEASAGPGAVEPLSWRGLLSAQAPSRLDLRRLVLVQPTLDFTALQPGAEAITLIRKTAADLGLTPDKGVTLRLTGPVPLADEEFSTVAEGAAVNTAATIVVVFLLLFAALKSWRLVAAVFVTLLAGLIVTAGFGLLVVGEYNLISVAFAVLFVGLGVDFSIQLAVRYRDIRLGIPDLFQAISAATIGIRRPLLLAAASTSIGFLAFLPTSFKGVSELGLIAGCGMVIAFLTSMILLPALLTVLSPPAEREAVGYAWLASADRLIEHHRRAIVIGAGALFLAGMPALAVLRFDSNPMNLRDQSVESVAAFLDLNRDPETSPMTLDVIVPSIAAAGPMAERLAALPEVSRVASIVTFVPPNQEARLEAVADASVLMDTVLDPVSRKLPRSREAMGAEISETRAALAQAVALPGLDPAERADLRRLDNALGELAAASAERYQRVEQALVAGIAPLLDRLRTAFDVAPITIADVPYDLRADWVAADGRARIEVLPRGDANDPVVMGRFVDAVRAIAPVATGAPVTIIESGRTVVQSFIVAAVLALAMITVLLFVVLGRAYDVFVTLVPLVVAVTMSLQAAVLLGIPLNFANIIALPLMCGVSVAFHIYFVLAWRQGIADVLASSLTRAILFSALTTATAFGSLWLSSHPGTASMGKLLTISLFFTMLAAFVFVPAFLGPPETQLETEAPRKSE